MAGPKYKQNAHYTSTNVVAYNKAAEFGLLKVREASVRDVNLVVCEDRSGRRV